MLSNKKIRVQSKLLDMNLDDLSEDTVLIFDDLIVFDYHCDNQSQVVLPYETGKSNDDEIMLLNQVYETVEAQAIRDDEDKSKQSSPFDDNVCGRCQYHDEVISSKKRKPDDRHSSTLTCYDQSPMYISLLDPIEHLARFPYEMFGSMNVKNISALAGIVDLLMHDSCVCRWAEPNIEMIGKVNMIKYQDILLTTIPDAAVVIKGIKFSISPTSNLIILKCRCHFSGTCRADTHDHFDDLFGSASPLAVDYMDASQISPDQLRALEVENRRLVAQKRAIRIFGASKLNFYYDPKLRKFVGYHDKFRLLSFSEAPSSDVVELS